MRDRDLSTTHSIMNPQVDRSKPEAEQAMGEVALHKVGETAKGIVVRGARMLATLAPFADELTRLPGLGHPAAGRQLRTRVRDPDGHAGAEVHLPRQLLQAARRVRLPALLALRRDGRRRHLRRRRDPAASAYSWSATPEGYSEVITDTGWRGHIMHQAFTRAYVKLSFAFGLGHMIGEHDRRRPLRPHPGEARPDLEHGRADPRRRSSPPRPARILDEGGVWYPDDRPFLALRGEMPKWLPVRQRAAAADRRRRLHVHAVARPTSTARWRTTSPSTTRRRGPTPSGGSGCSGWPGTTSAPTSAAAASSTSASTCRTPTG